MANKDLSDFALAILVLGLTVTIGSMILTSYKTGQVTNLPTYQVANESITMGAAGTTLNKTWVKSIDTMINATSNGGLNSGNYTLTVNSDFGTGKLINTTAIANVNVTYSVYNLSDVRYSLADKAASGVLEYGNWFKLLVIIGVAGLVLYLVFKAMGKGTAGTGSSGGAY